MNVTGSASGEAVTYVADAGAGMAAEDASQGPDLLRRIVEHAPVLIAVVRGADHRIVLANAAIRALLPAARSVRGRKIAKVLPAPVGRAAIPFLDDVFATGRPLRLREFGMSVDARGTMRFWDANLTPLSSDRGVDAILIMASDVTPRVMARQKAEQMAQEAVQRAREAEDAQRMLDALMAYIPAGIAIADAPDMRVRRVSYHGLAMTKRPWQEVIDEVPAERIPERWHFYHADGKELAGPEEFPLRRATKRGEIVSNEQWLLRQNNGGLVPVLCNAGPILDARGKVTGAVMAWLDIGSLEESRRKLLDAAKRFELAIEAGNLGMWDYNLSTGELVCSERCKTSIGLGPDTPVTYAGFLRTIHPEDRSRADIAMRRALDPDGDGEHKVEFRVTWPDHSLRWIAARGRAFFEDVDGVRRPVRLIGTLRDITERVQAVMEKESLLRQKDLLLREMNHRVNNSLQIISSLLRLQAMTQPPHVRAQLEETRTRVQTVAQVHRRLYQRETFTAVEIATYLRGLCEDLARSLGHACRSRIRLVADTAEVPTEVAMSTGLIVNELVTNAFKYAYDEPSAEGVDVRFERRPNGYHLSVSDNGRGLPAGFDPEKEVGLGMRVVASLVERLGAEMRLGPAGRGARFDIRIPDAAAARTDSPAVKSR